MIAVSFKLAPASQVVALPVTGPLPRLRKVDWGKLPEKMARELIEGRREKVPAEYREMVETYFRVIAEKARRK